MLDRSGNSVKREVDELDRGGNEVVDACGCAVLNTEGCGVENALSIHGLNGHEHAKAYAAGDLIAIEDDGRILALCIGENGAVLGGYELEPLCLILEVKGQAVCLVGILNGYVYNEGVADLNNGVFNGFGERAEDYSVAADDLNVAGDIGMLDRGGHAAKREVHKFDSNGSEGIFASGRGVLRTEGRREHDAFAAHSFHGHEHAEAHAAFDGVAVKNDGAVEGCRIVKNGAVLSGDELEVRSIVVELEVHAVSLVDALDVYVHVEGLPGNDLLGDGLGPDNNGLAVIGDLDLIVDDLMLDGSLNAAKREVCELNNVLNEGIYAGCSGVLYAEGCGVEHILHGEARGGHHGAVTDTAGDGGAVEGLEAAVCSDLLGNGAVYSGYELESVRIVVELMVEGVCFGILARDAHGDLEGVTGLELIGVRLNDEGGSIEDGTADLNLAGNDGGGDRGGLAAKREVHEVDNAHIEIVDAGGSGDLRPEGHVVDGAVHGEAFLGHENAKEYSAIGGLKNNGAVQAVDLLENLAVINGYELEDVGVEEELVVQTVCLIAAIDLDRNGEFVACLNIGMLGIDVEGCLHGLLALKHGDVAGDVGVRDGGSIAERVVYKVNADGGERVGNVLGRGALLTEGNAEESAFAGHRRIGHENAKAYTAGDGVAIKNDGGVVRKSIGENAAVCRGNELEVLAVVVELEVHRVSLVFAGDLYINGELVGVVDLGVLGINVDGYLAGSGSYRSLGLGGRGHVAANVDVAGNVGMLDRGVFAADGVVRKLGNKGSQLGVALGSAVLNTGGHGEENASGGYGSDRHHEAETDAAGDGGVVDERKAVEAGRIDQHVAVGSGEDLENVGVVVELEIEGVRLKLALYHYVEGNGVAGHRVLSLGHYVEYSSAGYRSRNRRCGYGHRSRGLGHGSRSLGCGSGSLGDLDLAGDIFMIDGSLFAIGGIVDELNGFDSNGIDAGGRGLLRPEGEGEHNAFAGHGLDGHQNAEAHAALDGLAIKNHKAVEVCRVDEDLAVFRGNELEVFAVVIKLEVKRVSFVIALDLNVYGDFLTGFGLGVVGIDVEGCAAGFGGNDSTDMNDAGNVLMRDGGRIRANGSVVELGDNGGKLIVAFSGIIADNGGNGEQNAVCGEAVGRHHRAEADGAGDGGVVGEHDAAKGGHLLGNLTVFNGLNGEDVLIVVELEVEGVRLKLALHHHVEGDGVAGHRILLLGHHVEDRAAGCGSYRRFGNRRLGGRMCGKLGCRRRGNGLNDLDLRAGGGIVDGGLNGYVVALNGSVGEGDNNGSEIVYANGSIVLRLEGGGENDTVLGERVGGHQNAEAYAAGDGLAVENHERAEVGSRGENGAVLRGYELEVFAVVIKLEVEGVCLEIAVKVDGYVEGVACLDFLIIGKHGEVRMTGIGSAVYGKSNIVDRGIVAGRIGAVILLVFKLDHMLTGLEVDGEGFPVFVVFAVGSNLCIIYINAQAVPVVVIGAFAHADEFKGESAAFRTGINRGGKVAAAARHTLIGAASINPAVPFNNNFPGIIGAGIVEYELAALNVDRLVEIGGCRGLGGLHGRLGGILSAKHDRAVLGCEGQIGRASANGIVADLKNDHGKIDSAGRILVNGEVDRHKNAAAGVSGGRIHCADLGFAGLTGEIGQNKAAVGIHAAARSY